MCVMSLAFAAVALGLPYWEYYDRELVIQPNSWRIKTNRGLWEYCIYYEPKTPYNNTCGDPLDKVLNGSVGSIRVTRGLIITAIVVITVELAMIFLVTCMLEQNFPLHYIATGLGIVAGLLLLTALALYIARVLTSNYDLHAAAACNIISIVVAWTSAGFISAAARVKKQN